MNTNAKTWMQDLLLLTVFLAILFGAFLGTRPLSHPDEGRYAEIPREMVVTGDYTTPHLNYIKYFEKPVLFYWMQAAAIKVFGTENWALRFVTALMGLVGCLFTYIAGRKLFSRPVGWTASIILSTTILYCVMAHTITLDMTVTVWLTACLFSFILGQQVSPGRQRNYYMWAMYIFSALATLTKGLIGFLIPGMVIFIWLLLNNNWRDLKTYCIPTGIILWLVITLPWHIAVQLKNPEFFDFYIVQQHFARYLTNYADRDQPLWYLPTFLIGGFLPWVGLVPQAIRFNWPRNWSTRKFYQKESFLLLWAILVYLFFQASHSQLPPYVLPVYPALAILVSQYLVHAWENPMLHRRGIRVGFGIAGMIAIIAGLMGLLVSTIPNWLLPPGSLIYVLVTSCLLVFTGFATLLALWQKSIKATFYSLAIGMGMILISLNLTYTPFDPKTIQPLMPTLLPLLEPDTEVVAYHGYYQDLPVYTQRRVTIVEWSGELTFGIQNQDTSDWIINDQTLWQRWRGPKRMFMIMKRSDYDWVKTHTKEILYPLAATKRNILVTNQSIKP